MIVCVSCFAVLSMDDYNIHKMKCKVLEIVLLEKKKVKVVYITKIKDHQFMGYHNYHAVLVPGVPYL